MKWAPRPLFSLSDNWRGRVVETTTVEERAAALARRVAAREGCELVHCEYVNQAGRWVLRLFIDRADGVTIDDCSVVSRQMSAVLDVEDFIPHAYNLEVSSPGLDRPLHSADDFRRFLGERAKVRTATAVRGRRRFSGLVSGVEGNIVTLEEPGGQRFEIPLEQVRSARLDPEL